MFFAIFFYLIADLQGHEIQDRAGALCLSDRSFVRYSLTGQSLNIASLDITMVFRTLHPEGLLMYGEGLGGDSFQLSLSAGRLRFIVSKDSLIGEPDLKIDVGSNLGDGMWHQAQISCINAYCVLMADIQKRPGKSRAEHIRVDHHVNIGATGKWSAPEMYARNISLDLQYVSVNNIEIIDSSSPSSRQAADVEIVGDHDWCSSETASFFMAKDDILRIYLKKKIKIKPNSEIGFMLPNLNISYVSLTGENSSSLSLVILREKSLSGFNNCILETSSTNRFKVSLRLQPTAVMLNDQPCVSTEKHSYPVLVISLEVSDTFFDSEKIRYAFVKDMFSTADIERYELITPAQTPIREQTDWYNVEHPYAVGRKEVCDIYPNLCSKDMLSFPKTCADHRTFGNLSSGEYYIMVNKGLFVQVSCDLSSPNSTKMMIPLRNQSSRTLGEAGPIHGMRYFHIEYTLPASVIRVIAKRTDACSQYLRYTCFQSVLFGSPHLYASFVGDLGGRWYASSGQMQQHWAGASNGSLSCACGETRNCKDRRFACNCDSKAPAWQADEGVIADKSVLPVLMLQFSLRETSQESSFILGPLECEYHHKTTTDMVSADMGDPTQPIESHGVDQSSQTALMNKTEDENRSRTEPTVAHADSQVNQAVVISQELLATCIILSSAFSGIVVLTAWRLFRARFTKSRLVVFKDVDNSLTLSARKVDEFPYYSEIKYSK